VRLEERYGLLRGRDVVIGVATDRAGGIGRAEHGLDLVLVHARLDLIEIHIDEDVAMAVDLGAAACKRSGAKQKRDKRGQHRPDGDRLQLAQL